MRLEVGWEYVSCICPVLPAPHPPKGTGACLGAATLPFSPQVPGSRGHVAWNCRWGGGSCWCHALAHCGGPTAVVTFCLSFPVASGPLPCGFWGCGAGGRHTGGISAPTLPGRHGFAAGSPHHLPVFQVATETSDQQPVESARAPSRTAECCCQFPGDPASPVSCSQGCMSQCCGGRDSGWQLSDPQRLDLGAVQGLSVPFGRGLGKEASTGLVLRHVGAHSSFPGTLALGEPRAAAEPAGPAGLGLGLAQQGAVPESQGSWLWRPCGLSSEWV